MCIAIFRTSKAAPITRETLRICRKNNEDGLGLMWAEGGTLHTYKTLDAYTDFEDTFMALQDRGLPLVAHFRLATHGHINDDNAHPYLIHPDLGIVHNGILSHELAKTHKSKSDTRVFAEKLLRQLPKFWWRNPAICTLLEEAIGYSNKLVVMHSSGDVVISNEKAGVWDQGSWYSNTGYRAVQTSVADWFKRGRQAVSSTTGPGKDIVVRQSSVEPVAYGYMPEDEDDKRHGGAVEGFYCPDCVPMNATSRELVPIMEAECRRDDQCDVCGAFFLWWERTEDDMDEELERKLPTQAETAAFRAAMERDAAEDKANMMRATETHDQRVLRWAREQAEHGITTRDPDTGLTRIGPLDQQFTNTTTVPVKLTYADGTVLHSTVRAEMEVTDGGD